MHVVMERVKGQRMKTGMFRSWSSFVLSSLVFSPHLHTRPIFTLLFSSFLSLVRLTWVGCFVWYGWFDFEIYCYLYVLYRSKKRGSVHCCNIIWQFVAVLVFSTYTYIWIYDLIMLSFSPWYICLVVSSHTRKCHSVMGLIN